MLQGFFSFLFFPFWIVIFVLLLIFLFLIIWIWAIVHCLTSRLNPAEKLFWLVVMVLLNIIGVVLYFIFSRTVRIGKMEVKGKRLLRSRKNRIIAGVCSGIGNYLGIDPTVIRLLWVLFTLFSMGIGILVYIIAWIIIPEER